MRLATAPKNGRVVVRRVRYTATNRQQCLAAQVPALVALYRSTNDFEGTDIATLEIRFEGRQPQFRRYTIAVTNASASTYTITATASGAQAGDRCGNLSATASSKPDWSGDADCDTAAGYACIGGACKIPKGGACTDTDVCEFGQCVDGVCCENACEGACRACVESLTGEPDGECEPVPAAQDPENECTEDPGYPGSCQADGAGMSGTTGRRSPSRQVGRPMGKVAACTCGGAGSDSQRCRRWSCWP